MVLMVYLIMEVMGLVSVQCRVTPQILIHEEQSIAHTYTHTHTHALSYTNTHAHTHMCQHIHTRTRTHINNNTSRTIIQVLSHSPTPGALYGGEPALRLVSLLLIECVLLHVESD